MNTPNNPFVGQSEAMPPLSRRGNGYDPRAMANGNELLLPRNGDNQ